MGFDKQSTECAQAGLVYALYEFSDERHVVVSRDPLLAKTREMLVWDWISWEMPFSFG
jgi:hypothetical protein